MDGAENSEFHMDAESLIHMLSRTPAIVYQCGPGPVFPITYISDSIQTRLGYAPEEFYQDPRFFEKQMHPDDLGDFNNAMKCLKKDIPGSCEYRVRLKTGYYVWVLDEFRLTFDKQGKANGIVGSIVNITDRVLVEQALSMSQERLALALEGANLGFWDQNFKKGTVIRSRRWAEMLGYSFDEIDTTLNSWKDLIHPDDKALTDKTAKQHEEGLTSAYKVEHRMRTKDGDWKWILNWGKIIERDDAGNPVRATGVHLDISDRKKAELKLKESEERFRAIFESAQDSIFMKDGAMTYVSVNPAMEKLLGMPADKIIGKNDVELFGEAVGKKQQEDDRQVLKGRILANENIKTIHGVNRVFDVIKVPMRDSSGEVIGLCGIARDVTETKRLQDFSSRALRLETAGRIAGQVAHDFNNLLGPLTAYPELIKNMLPQNHQAIDFLNFMEKTAVQMADINQQLLTLGRRGHYNQETLNLNHIIKDTIIQIQPHSDTLLIDQNLEENLLNIKGGAAQIGRILSNLIANARDALSDMGVIVIKTENVYMDQASGEMDHIPLGEYVKLTISDSGVGMSQETMAKMFDPFFTTKTTNKQRGSGLGLSIVHAVVEDHNGFIDYNSKKGVGTNFLIYFPVTRDIIDTVPEQIIGGNERVLVVDDDPVHQEVANTLLKKLGYRVFLSDSGEDALLALKKESMDLVILDMIMPGGMDGAETYEKMLKIRPKQRAIILSGFAESQRVTQALEMGAGAYLRKPLTFKTIAQAVRKELDRR